MSRTPTPSRGAVLARASIRTALGTSLSRATGLARLVMVAYALGGKNVGDAFNLANTTPNIVHDLVLGGVLAATFVPVFIDRQARHAADAGASISAVVTVSAVLLVVATVLFELAAPLLVDLYTVGTGKPAEQHLAVELLRFFAPQLAFYGAISLMSAVLATRDRFAVVGIVPVINNLICIAVLALFHSLDNTPQLGLLNHPGLVALLGLGTTAGVLAQALALLPSLVRSGAHIRFDFRPRDPALRRIMSLSGWTFGIIATNQAAVFVVLILAYHLDAGGGAVSAYTYAYAFFQFPFAIAATSIVNVATPDLARAFTAADYSGMARRFAIALRQMLAVILPATVGYLLLAGPAVTLALRHGAEQAGSATSTGSALAFFAIGLPGYCVFFLVIRTLQAMQDTRSAFICYAFENAVNIGLAFVLYERLGVRGLALSFSVAYVLGAVVALVVLHRSLGSLGGVAVVRWTTRALGLSLAMALVVALVSTATGSGTGIGGWIRLLVAIGAGVFVYFIGAGVAGTLAASRGARRIRGTPPRTGRLPGGYRRRY